MFTFDDVWDALLVEYKTETNNIPNTQEEIYALIKNSVRMYNNRMPVQLILDIESESVYESNDIENTIIILAAFIKLNMLENERIYYTTLFQPINSDVGIRNYNTQTLAMSRGIARQEEIINALVFNLGGDWDY